MHLTSIQINANNFPVKDQYPFSLDVFQKTPGISLETPITFFAGENGSGKSTLIRALAHRCGIHIWKGPERTRFRFNPLEEELYRCIDVHWSDQAVPGSFFSAEYFYDFSSLIDEWAHEDPGVLNYYGSKPFMTQSHGQSHMSYFENRYIIKGLYLLDEPENALSPTTQLKLLHLLQRMSIDGHAQFIIATHSPILLSCENASIYSFDHVPLRKVPYEETEHYLVYRSLFKK